MKINGFWGNKGIIPGALEQKEDGILVLSVIENLHIKDSLSEGYYLVITGYDESGKEYTLLDCTKINFTFNVTGFNKSEYFVRHAVIGKHFKGPQDLKFNGASADFSNLFIWLDGAKIPKSNLTFRNKLENKLEVDEYTLKFKVPERIRERLRGRKQIEYSFGITIPGRAYSQKEYSVKTNASVAFKQRHYVKPDTIVSRINSFRNLLIFCCQGYISSNRISLCSKGKYFEIVTSRIEMGKYIEKKHPTYLICTHSELLSLCSNYFDTWTDLEEKYSGALDLILEATQNEYLPPEKLLFNLVTAIESYHRIKYSINKSLVDRMTDVFKDLKPAFNHVTKINNHIGFCQKIADTRNYHAHILETKAKKRLQGNKLLLAIKKLRLINISWILNEMGIDKPKIADILKIKQI